MTSINPLCCALSERIDQQISTVETVLDDRHKLRKNQEWAALPQAKQSAGRPLRTYQKETIAFLYATSGGRCTYPACDMKLLQIGVDGRYDLGEKAHIFAMSDNGPRANKSLTAAERNDYDNLILLCPTHHTQVDKNNREYPAKLLKEWKTRQESDHDLLLLQHSPRVRFPELDAIAMALLENPGPPSSPNDWTETKKKLVKNDLSGPPEIVVLQHSQTFGTVTSYVEDKGLNDPHFAQKLVAGFKQEYDRLYELELRGPLLFKHLRSWVTAIHRGSDYDAAALGILTYMFITCEVFEP